MLPGVDGRGGNAVAAGWAESGGITGHEAGRSGGTPTAGWLASGMSAASAADPQASVGPAQLARGAPTGADAERDMFDVLDLDEDGALTKLEFQKFRDGYCARPDPTGQLLFSLLDRDGDGRLKPSEFRQFFASADLDGDGYITRSKFAHYEQVVAPIARESCGDDQLADCPHMQPVRLAGAVDEDIAEFIQGVLDGFRTAPQQSRGHADEAASPSSAASPPATVPAAWPAFEEQSDVAGHIVPDVPAATGRWRSAATE